MRPTEMRLRNASEQFSSEAFGLKHVLSHVASEALRNARAFELMQSVPRGAADDEFKIAAL